MSEHTDVDTRTGHVLPYDRAAEESLIGAMLLTADAVQAGRDGCTADDFAAGSPHRLIYRAILETAGPGLRGDAVVVAAWLKTHATHIPADTLVTAMAHCPNHGQAARYASLIRETARIRRIYSLGAAIVDTAIECDAVKIRQLAYDVIRELDHPQAGGCPPWKSM